MPQRNDSLPIHLRTSFFPQPHWCIFLFDSTITVHTIFWERKRFDHHSLVAYNLGWCGAKDWKTPGISVLRSFQNFDAASAQSFFDESFRLNGLVWGWQKVLWPNFSKIPNFLNVARKIGKLQEFPVFRSFQNFDAASAQSFIWWKF